MNIVQKVLQGVSLEDVLADARTCKTTLKLDKEAFSRDLKLQVLAYMDDACTKLRTELAKEKKPREPKWKYFKGQNAVYLS